MINNISKFIEDCNEQGILFIVENDELTIKTKRPTLPEEMLVEIKRNKQQIISFFNKKYRVLSFAQERLWFIDQYDHNASYNMPKAVKLIGKLDTKVLEKTFSEIIRRHEVLRTNIITINNVAAQFIHKEPKFELKTVDQSYLSEEETNQQIQKLIEIESQKPFDLANDSLIRLVLYKINDEEHTLFLNKHHIIS
ncbi:MAG: hypothetical protein GY756_04795, partial [bacterium]|nr:hypothetical protein [bacterium]